MIDIRLILTETEKVKAMLAKKGCDADLGKIIELDGKPFRGYFISHKQLTDAGRLTIYCTDKPKR